MFSLYADITDLVETRSSRNHLTIYLPLYEFLFSVKLRKAFGDGVALVTRTKLRAFRRTDLEVNGLEFLLAELCTVHWLVYIFYGPRNQISLQLPVFLGIIHKLS